MRKSMSTLSLYVMILSIFLMVSMAFATDHLVGYQGKLTDVDGIGINGEYDINFKLYNALVTGTLIDDFTVIDVNIEKGLFNADILFDLEIADFATDLYLEITVDGDVMTPRQIITAEMLAFHAILADEVPWSGVTDAPDISLQGSYDGGYEIVIDGEEVDIDAPESAPHAGDGGRALDVTGNDDMNDVFRAYNAGDGPAIYSSGHLRMSGTATTRIYSTANIDVQVDRGDVAGSTNQSFNVRDGVDAVVFSVDEEGLVEGSRLNLDDVQTDPSPATSDVLTIDASGNVLKTTGGTGGADTDWTMVSGDMYNTDLGNVSIGQSAVPAVDTRLEVLGTGEVTEKAIVGKSTTGPEGWLGTAIYGAYGQFDSFNFGALGTSGIGIDATGATYAGRFTGDIYATGAYKDSDDEAGTIGQILSSTVTGTDWIDAPLGVGGFIEDQFTVAQEADFWIDGQGRFGIPKVILFEDNFSTDLGWTLDADPASEWERAVCIGLGSDNADPTEDVTSSNTDNMVLGYDLTENGDYEIELEATYYATSPVIDCSSEAGSVRIGFWRKLGVEHSGYDHANIEVFDGTDWIEIWANPEGALFTVDDATWIWCQYDVSTEAVGNALFQIRFGMGTTDDSVVSFGWNIDDFIVFSGLGAVDISNGDIDAEGDIDAGGDIEAFSFTLDSETITSWDEFIRSIDTLVGENVDTIVVMNDFKVVGELIADSMQAVGDVIAMDDNVHVYGCLELEVEGSVFYSESFDWITLSADWDIVVITDPDGDAEITFETATVHPSGYVPSDGTHLVCFNSWTCDNGDQLQLEQLTSVSTIGYTSVILNFDILHDVIYTNPDEGVTLRYSLDGILWNDLVYYPRYDGTTGWETITEILPAECADIADLYIAFLFDSRYGNDVHIDNLVMSEGFPVIDLCDGDIYADGSVEASSFILDGDEITEWASAVRFDTLEATDHDTIVVNMAMKVVGELIADSIQAVGDSVIIDDHLKVDGKVHLARGVVGDNSRSDWEAENIITVGVSNADFVDLNLAILYANANAPMTIMIAPGEYLVPDVTINAEVVLMGSGMENTRINDIEMAVLTLGHATAECYNIFFDIPVESQGILRDCRFFKGVTLNAGELSDCKISGTTTVNYGGEIEGCSMNDFIVLGGMLTISDCAISGFCNVLESCTIHMTGCELIGVLSCTGLTGSLPSVLYLEGNVIYSGGVSLVGNCSGEFKANHFVECEAGIAVTEGASANIMGNDFIACMAAGVVIDVAHTVHIMDNQFDGKMACVNGIDAMNGPTFEFIASGNHIVNHALNGLTLGSTIDSPSSCIISHNNVTNNVAIGIEIQMVAACLLTHNNVVGNAQDLALLSPVVVSYNTLDTWFAGVSPVPGCLNQNSTGILHVGGVQPGQLP